MSFRRDPQEPTLFADGDLTGLLRARDRDVAREIQAIDADRLLATDAAAWVDHFVSLHHREGPRLRTDDITTSGPVEVQVEVAPAPWHRPGARPVVAGSRVVFHIPLDGDSVALRYRPSQYYMNTQRGGVSGSELTLAYVLMPGALADEVRRDFDSELETIATMTQRVATDIDRWSAQLPSNIRSWIDERRSKLLADRVTVDAFGFPVRRRADAPHTYVVPTVRRQIVPAPSTPRPNVAAPDPAMDLATYDAILGVCQQIAMVMECSADAFSKMGEEDLRTHFLVPLNAQFKGAATGETFNYQGKTDILVRVNGRNIFIAVCKFWTGPASLTGAIEQVLGYLAWRDTKAAVFVFNRNKDFSAVLRQIPDVVRAHPRFVRQEPSPLEGSFRAVLARADDPDQRVWLTVLPFEVPR